MKKNQSVAIFNRVRRAPKGVNAALVLVLSIGMSSPVLQAQALGPAGGVVVAGNASITGEGTASTRIEQFSDRAVIDWRSFGIGAAGEVIFLQPSSRSAILNRVTGEQVSLILGRLDANGHVLLINPNGIVFGGGAQVNVGSLVATTSNITDANFMSGRLTFDQPGRPGAGVLNAGTITARDGGLVALVAPHVRNDGVIVARLGKVWLGAADTFTIDLYGDALINLALSDVHAGQLRQANGEPVTSLITNTGRIDTAGGQAVLMTAHTAKNVLDSLINTSGVIRADNAVQQGGRILLLGEGGTVEVGGIVSAQGVTGGTIEVLGSKLHLSSGASLDASGSAGGGTVHVGGAWQGSGDTYRAEQTTIDAGATLKANAIDSGRGGEVVVWSDGLTSYSGSVEARGGQNGGDGGRMEVSGKGILEFLGQADASSPAGEAGLLLLDPAYLDIGPDEASVITRVLRTGTNTLLQADIDINVNSAIFGGDREAGGGLTINAGNNININDVIVTNDGAINLFASKGTVNFAPGTAVYAGSAPITISACGDLRSGWLFTGGSLSIESLTGSVFIDSFIDGRTGPVSIRAAGDVDINQPIVNLVSGADALTVTAGSDINVNAPVDGRGGAEGGAVTMTAAGDLNVNKPIVTNNGAVSLTATEGTLNVAPDAVMLSGDASMALSARGDVTIGPISAGALAVASVTGSVAVDGLIDAATGDTRISAGTDVNINDFILNGQSGGDLSVVAGRDVNVNAAIDGRGDVAGGAVTMTAARDLNVNDWLVTNTGAIDLVATNGELTVAAGKGLFAGQAPIAMRSAGDLITGAISGGSLSATSTAGSVWINGIIDGSTGRVDLGAGNDVIFNQPVLNLRTGNLLNATAGRDIIVNAQIDGRGGATGGPVTLTAARNVAINNSVVTNDGSVDIMATTGALTMAPGTALVTGNAPITLTAARDVTLQGISGGFLRATSTTGSVLVNGVIDGNTGGVVLDARWDVNINQAVLNTSTGSPFNAYAGHDINVNAPIDGRGGSAGGAVNLDASGNINVNAPIATADATIRLSTENGITAFAPGGGLFAGAGTISLYSFGSVTTGALSGGAIDITSGAGSITVAAPITSVGSITIGAAGQVNIDRSITNPGATSSLTVTAGTDINVNAQIGRTEEGVTSGAVALTAAGNVNLNDSIVTEGGSIKVTAQTGEVTSAAGEGLFAGSGSVSVESGQTFSTPTVATTGTVTLRSTGGSVNVDTPIDGSTGGVTIAAAADVNVNQGIANPRSDAPLSITAGNDINVNAAIDGDDGVLAGPSGTVTMTAGNNIQLNESIVAKNSAISLTAGSGTIATAPGEGLFAGSGTISLTSGGTLDLGLVTTSGTLNLTSTAGSVNIDTAIPDATGTVNIVAASTVNINETITNLKSGGNLAITAGTDINVLAQIDGRGGVAGAAVTMTAGNDINVTESIATNNGAVSLTATAGTITLPIGVETFDEGLPDPDPAHPTDDVHTPMEWIVSAGTAPISITTGDDFFLRSPVVTTGALAITSTNGSVTIAAPITDETGAVTITAADAITVSHQVKSNDQPIVLTAGAGGITVSGIVDYDETHNSPVNSGTADLTLNSVGNVSILDSRGIASGGTVTIDTRGLIVNGSVGYGPARPQAIVLNADGGIVSFDAGNADSITATSSGGSISLAVFIPGMLRITTGTPGTTDCPTCDINTGGLLGPDAVLNAGGSVNLSLTQTVGTVNLIARSGDVNLSEIVAGQLTANAGRDVNLGSGGLPQNAVWLKTGPLTLTAGRDIITTANSPIHVSNGQSLTLSAGRNLLLNVIETLGSVSLTSTTGNITLNNDIGPHIVNLTPQADFNPLDKGVASLTMSAPAASASITMQGARAEGDVAITTAGSLTAAKQITSVSGVVTITAGSMSLSAVPIGTQNQLLEPTHVAPAIPAGPRANLPTPPGLASIGATGAPAFAEIPVAIADQMVDSVARPGAAGGSLAYAGAPGGRGAPAGTTGANGAPGVPTGGGGSQPSGSSDPSALDSANAQRAAGLACGEEGESGTDTGLAAVTPGGSKEDSDRKKAECPSPASGEKTATATPAASSGSSGSRR